MRFGVPLGLVHPALWKDLAVEADRLGFDSVWIPEHLVFTTDLSTANYPGTSDPGINPKTPLFDALGYLSHLAAVTRHVRLGTAVYLYGLRHPLISARAFATLDQLSGGRAIVGVGSGWYRGEWDAAGVDFRTRGSRLDEALELSRRLWTEPVVAHEGRHFTLPEVAFEPKPVQPVIPVTVGGESDAALRRAARNDGWISMPQTLDAIAPRLALLAKLRAEADVDRTTRPPFETTVHAYSLASPSEIPSWQSLGVDRLIVRPWTRSRDAIASLEPFATAYGITPPTP
ncbi:TIGR03619 family F420-dependent LLM class oxidoreductase [Actinocorallia sp. A-T 12471]|uniref:TIGR03619 family F420-dependent LLM class oxidoreductase n=1 Tax=Actinocorallia sp. A-T 12471 TaxID=3089813 RepID=UPI0029CF0F0C|nr:TIGR03619 family F420-dependent LLM class oxidoreductase [Actinocorallia sp. A-T 12471]MDX6743351.1 TIGR03619 family F420-dependent LLM class oxidoreductase [Actinocorallia sp. A-T 12471]